MELPGESVLTRVIDALENGIGGLLRPWQTVRVARANAEARRLERHMLEQTEMEIADLRAGRKRLDGSGKLIACDLPSPLLIEGPKSVRSDVSEQRTNLLEFAQATADAKVAQEMQRGVNLRKIALYAEEEAEAIDKLAESRRHGTKDNQPNLDADWFAKWRAGAQEVSRDEMQRLWGKLLAGEVAKSGSYSLHTIDFLGRMSSADADLIARVAPFATSAGIVKVGFDYFADNAIKFDDLLYLDSLGLLNGLSGVGGVSYTLGRSEVNGRVKLNLRASNLVLIFDMGEVSKSPPNISLEVINISRVCSELLTLASIQVREDYLMKISEIGISKGAEEVIVGEVHQDGSWYTEIRSLAKKSQAPSSGG
jgi:hypothetical protein